MKISVIIPTLNRPDDLSRCLEAIVRNTIQPDEVVIIEQGDVQKTEEIVRLSGINAQVIFLSEKSLTIARNLGIKETYGDLIIFIDDDVVVTVNYFATLKDYFLSFSNVKVLGIVGKDLVYSSKQKSWTDYVRQAIGVIFWRSTFGNRSRVLLSGHNVLRNTADEEQVIEWISGASMVYRRSVFDVVSFDTRFIRWSFNEDVSLSYQVHQLYPNSLRYIPALEYSHNESKTERLLNEQIIRMSVIYRYIFWSEQIKHKSVFSVGAYIWSQVGFCVIQLISYPSFKTFYLLSDTYKYILKNRTSILKGDCNFNVFILSQQR